MTLKVNKNGKLSFPALKFFSEENARKIRQYSLDFREGGYIYLTFYDNKGKVVRPKVQTKCINCKGRGYVDVTAGEFGKKSINCVKCNKKESK